MAKSHITPQLYAEIVDRDGTCVLCGGPGGELDHIVPRSHFGSKRVAEQDAPTNLRLLCVACHRRRHG